MQQYNYMMSLNIFAKEDNETKKLNEELRKKKELRNAARRNGEKGAETAEQNKVTK